MVISNQERSDKRISKLLQQGKVAWIDSGILHPKSQVGKSVSLNDSSNPTNSDNGTARLGVNSSANDEKLSLGSEWSLTETPNESEGPDLVPTSDNVISSDRKVNTLSSDKQEINSESSAKLSAMEARVRELAGVMHLDNVEIVTDASTLSGKRAKAKGFFNRRTGKITIVLPNNADVADVHKQEVCSRFSWSI